MFILVIIWHFPALGNVASVTSWLSVSTQSRKESCNGGHVRVCTDKLELPSRGWKQHSVGLRDGPWKVGRTLTGEYICQGGKTTQPCPSTAAHLDLHHWKCCKCCLWPLQIFTFADVAYASKKQSISWCRCYLSWKDTEWFWEAPNSTLGPW